MKTNLLVKAAVTAVSEALGTGARPVHVGGKGVAWSTANDALGTAAFGRLYAHGHEEVVCGLVRCAGVGVACRREGEGASACASHCWMKVGD